MKQWKQLSQYCLQIMVRIAKSKNIIKDLLTIKYKAQ